MPIQGQDNAHLQLADHRAAAETITAFSERCHRDRVFLKLDCGVILCMFTREQIGRLFFSGCTFQSTCQPIPDIDADLNIWHCFPLSQVGTFHLDRFASPQELNAHLYRFEEEIASGGMFDECRFCPHYQRKFCRGGCLSHVIAANATGEGPLSIKEFGLEL
jgi:radical SAM protein with 4Fe4S-binding SPASM domain